MSLKIFYLCSWFPKVEGDINGSFFLEQAEQLSKNNSLDVFVIHQLHWQKLFKTSPFKLRNTKIKNVTVYYITTIGFERLPVVSLISWTLSFLYFLIMHKNKFTDKDIVHCNSAKNSGVGAYLIKTFFKKRVLLVEHSSYFLDEDKSFIEKYIYKHIYKKVDIVLAVSETLKRKLEEKYSTIVKDIIDNPINSTFKIDPFEKHTIDIVMIGQLTSVKRFSETLEQLTPVIVRHDFKVLIVGSGPDKNNILGVIQKFKLSENVSLIGELSREMIPQILNKSKTLILNSKHETFGIVAVEAAACGCVPLVNKNCGVAAYLTKKNIGHVFEEVVLPETLIKALCEKTDRNLMSMKILDTLSIEKYEKTMQIHYKSTLENKDIK